MPLKCVHCLFQTHHVNHSDELLQSIVANVYSIGVLIIVCEICQRIRQDFEECSEMVDQLDWYLFPVATQRLMPMILHFTQQPIEITYFGSKPCNRGTIKTVNVKPNELHYFPY